MADLYYLSMRSNAVCCVLGVNDVPLVVDSDGEGYVTDVPILLWLKPGENRLTAYLTWPDGVTYEPGKAELEASAYLHDPSQEAPTPLDTLASFSWPLPGVPEAYPFPFERPFVVSRPIATELWDRAEEIEELTDEDKREIVALVEKLRAAIDAKDAGGAYALQEFKYTEDAVAEGKPPERTREAVIEQYQWLFEQEHVRSDPLKLPQAQFRIVAGGQVVAVSRPNNVSAISIEQRIPAPPDEEGEEAFEEGLAFGIDVYVSRIDGVWTIVR